MNVPTHGDTSHAIIQFQKNTIKWQAITNIGLALSVIAQSLHLETYTGPTFGVLVPAIIAVVLVTASINTAWRNRASTAKNYES